MKRKHVPIRTCVGCRRTMAKKDMVRIVRTPEGNVEIDTSGKKSGRGAYVCPQPECLEQAIKKKALASILEVAVPSELVDDLRRLIDND